MPCDTKCIKKSRKKHTHTHTFTMLIHPALVAPWLFAKNSAKRAIFIKVGLNAFGRGRVCVCVCVWLRSSACLSCMHRAGSPHQKGPRDGQTDREAGLAGGRGETMDRWIERGRETAKLDRESTRLNSSHTC